MGGVLSIRAGIGWGNSDFVFATRWQQADTFPFKEKGAYAPLANNVSGNVKLTSKLYGCITV